MAVSMRTLVKRSLFGGIAVWMGFACAASCASTPNPIYDVCTAHSAASSPYASSLPLSTSLASSSPPTDIAPTATPPANSLLSNSERYEKITGITLSPIDKVIMNECPARAWSKNVPKRRCTSDEQCGDGLCDRGRCAAKWSCSNYGRPCKESSDCSTRPCIDGRCRSCMSERDCDWKRGLDVAESNITCRVDEAILGARECFGEVGSGFGTVIPAPSQVTKP